MTVGCVHDGVAQYGRGEFLDERRNCVRISLICLLDLSRRRILFDHLVEHVPPGLNQAIRLRHATAHDHLGPRRRKVFGS
jgi:hypothetical protein